MRIRRIEVEWGNGKVSLDCRSEGNLPLPVVGILGSSASGRSMLMKMVLSSFRNTMHGSLTSFEDWKEVSGYVEFDLGSAISSCVIRNGKIVQKLTYPDMDTREMTLSGGCLFYSSQERLFFASKAVSNQSFAETLIQPILHDLYKGNIRNSVIWVDDYALGLDDNVAQEFLRVLIRKALERDNQLIVSCDREGLLLGAGSEAIRVLRPSGTNLVEKVIKGLK